MRKILLVLLSAFLIVSFGFMGGWPFVSTEKDRPPLEKANKEAALSTPQVEDGATEPASPEANTADSSSLVASPAPMGVSAQVRQDRDSVAEAKKKGKKALRLALSKTVLNHDLPGSYRLEQLAVLRRVNQDTVFRPGKFKDAVDVKIVSGDSLTRIARRVKKAHNNNVTPAFLMKMNRLANARIRAGNLLSAPTETLKVVISKSDFRLYVLLGAAVVLDYPVGIGHSNTTPEGSFHIQGKTKNPTWTRPDGTVVRFGEDGHLIGNRWMGFATDRGRTPYGIHGTVENDSIGKEESEGCIRMMKSDVEEVFRLIPEGCAVEIRP